MPNVLAFITARGGSKGIPNKNITMLNRRPLIYFTIRAAKKAKCIKKIFLSTDSEEIKSVCEKYKVKTDYIRPDFLATDEAKSIDVVLDGLTYLEVKKRYIPDYVILLQPTSPLRTEKHIEAAYYKISEMKAESLVSVSTVPHNCIPESVMQLEGECLKPYLKSDLARRQDKPKYYCRNGAAIYIFTPEFIKRTKAFYDENTIPFFMSKEDSFDVDDAIDLKICSLMLKERKK